MYTNIITPNIEINIAHVSDVNVRRSFVGDISACLCKLRNGLHIVMVGSNLHFSESKIGWSR